MTLRKEIISASEACQRLLKDVFKQIFGREAPDQIEIDCAHRSLCLPSEDLDKPGDIICKLHKYSLKECIMLHVRGVHYVDFDGAKLSFPTSLQVHFDATAVLSSFCLRPCRRQSLSIDWASLSISRSLNMATNSPYGTKSTYPSS